MLHRRQLRKGNQRMFCEFQGCVSRKSREGGEFSSFKRSAEYTLMWGDRVLGNYCRAHTQDLERVWATARDGWRVAA